MTTISPLERHEQPPVKPNKESIFWRSTIYEHHERRHMKALLSANDDRPAIIRILAQLPGAQAHLPSTKTNSKDNIAANSTITRFAVPSDNEQDTTLFTMYPSPNQSSPSAFSFNTTLNFLASTASAYLASQWSNHCTSTFLSSGTLSTSSVNFSTTGKFFLQPHEIVVRGGESAAVSMSLMGIHNNNVQQVFVPINQENKILLRPWLPLRSYSPSCIPMTILFGTQAALEASWTRMKTDEQYNIVGTRTSPTDWGVLALSSGIAGAMVSLVQTGGRGMAGQSASAVVYFGLYRFLVVGWNKNDDGRDQQPSLMVTAAAGAAAGSVYELLRTYATTATQTRTLLGHSNLPWSPFVRPPVPALGSLAARTAPAHALFFVAYETIRNAMLMP